MTGMAVTLFVLAALLILMACVPADRWRALRSRTYPSGEELTTSSVVVGRVCLLVMAGLGIWQGIDMLRLAAH
ncbi:MULTISPECIES: hypothetical protein [Streptomyces]|uniref:Uncharacterized protein n=1 Tax=Streptomyces xanthii TaxID=2768069 RepID=A0A7H1B4X1_9ACTN|nr:hypothetical protein [Streptomyces xanthii]QNS03776.1 hypothetical protein IAG42_09150 [Streptomyces xanthii]